MFTKRSYSTTRVPSPTPSRAIDAAICSADGIMKRSDDVPSQRSSVRSAKPLRGMWPAAHVARPDSAR